MLNDLDETIKEMLVKGVPLDLSEIDVAFDAPTGEWSASLARPTVNCYLYTVLENQDLRSNQWEMDRVLGHKNGSDSRTPVGTKRRWPFRVDCCYMITCWANEPSDEHRLLWRALAALMRHHTLPPECLKGLLAGQEWPMPTKVAQPDGPLKNPSDFWSNMDGPIRAGFHYIVTLPLDPDLFLDVPLVLTRRVRTRIHDGQDIAAEWPTVQFGGWVRRDSALDAPVVPGAEVSIVERGVSVQTDAAGRFAFDRVPRGRYTLRARTDSAQVERLIDVPGEDYDLVLAEESGPAVSGTPGAGPAPPSDAAGLPPAAPSSPKNRRR